MDLRVVGRDRVGDLLHDDRLAGLGGRDDEAALALADRRDDVDHAGGELRRLGLEAQALLRVQRRQLAELRAALGSLGLEAVDRVEADQRVELAGPVGLGRLLAVAGLADRTGDRVAAAQAVALDLVERHVHVVRAGQVARGAHERVAVHQVEDARHGQQHVVVAELDVVEARELAGAGAAARATGLAVTIAVTVTVARAPATTAALLAVLAVLELTALRVGLLDLLRAALLAVGLLGATLLTVLLTVALLTVLLLTVLLTVLLALRLLLACVVAALRGTCAPTGPARPALPRHGPDGVGGTGRAVVDRRELGVQRGLEAGERVVLGRGRRRAVRLGTVGARRHVQVELGRLAAPRASCARGRLGDRDALGATRLERLGARAPASVRDGLDEVALAHLGGALDAQLGRHRLQLWQAERRDSGAAGGPAGGAHGGIDDVCHEGPFPSSVAGTRWFGDRPTSGRADRDGGGAARAAYVDVCARWAGSFPGRRLFFGTRSRTTRVT